MITATIVGRVRDSQLTDGGRMLKLLIDSADRVRAGEGWRSSETTIAAVVFGKRGEEASKRIRTGSLVALSGRLNLVEGKARAHLELVADSFEVLGGGEGEA